MVGSFVGIGDGKYKYFNNFIICQNNILIVALITQRCLVAIVEKNFRIIISGEFELWKVKNYSRKVKREFQEIWRTLNLLIYILKTSVKIF